MEGENHHHLPLQTRIHNEFDKKLLQLSVSSDGRKLMIGERTIDCTIDDSLTARIIRYVFVDMLEQTGATGALLDVIAMMNG